LNIFNSGKIRKVVRLLQISHLFLAHNPKQVDNNWCFFNGKSIGVTTMKAKTLSLVASMALAANVGVAQASELDETAGMPEILGATTEMPEILGSMDTASYQAMSQEEMAVVEGKFSLIDLCIVCQRWWWWR
jgi:hypothetical protein